MLTFRVVQTLLLVAAIAGPLSAAELSGRARIVDGDTLDLSGQKIRIEGIDAFESGQSCFDANGLDWPCGQAGTAHLLKLTRGKAISCTGDTYDLMNGC